jgi:hypothetical protein
MNKHPLAWGTIDGPKGDVDSRDSWAFKQADRARERSRDMFEVKPFEDKWALYVGGTVFATSKHRFDVDAAKARLLFVLGRANEIPDVRDPGRSES